VLIVVPEWREALILFGEQGSTYPSKYPSRFFLNISECETL
jgi:hypothetical protein